MAGNAVDGEALLAPGQERGVDPCRRGDRAVRLVAGHGACDRRPHARAVGKELAPVVGARARLVDHVLTLAATQRQHRHRREAEGPRHHRGTLCTEDGALRQGRQPALDLLRVEALRLRLDAEEEAVLRGALEAVDVEDRVVEPGQAVQEEEKEEDGERGDQGGDRDAGDDEGGPAQPRPPADVEDVVVAGGVGHHRGEAEAARQGQDRGHAGERWRAQGQGLGQLGQWHGRVGLQAVEAVATHRPGRVDQRLR